MVFLSFSFTFAIQCGRYWLSFCCTGNNFRTMLCAPKKEEKTQFTWLHQLYSHGSMQFEWWTKIWMSRRNNSVFRWFIGHMLSTKRTYYSNCCGQTTKIKSSWRNKASRTRVSNVCARIPVNNTQNVIERSIEKPDCYAIERIMP